MVHHDSVDSSWNVGLLVSASVIWFPTFLHVVSIVICGTASLKTVMVPGTADDDSPVRFRNACSLRGFACRISEACFTRRREEREVRSVAVRADSRRENVVLLPTGQSVRLLGNLFEKEDLLILPT